MKINNSEIGLFSISLRWLPVLMLVVFFYLVVLQIIAIWPFTVDDMYITLRYAKHWSQGSGLLWNVGEPPVEGYSNFSFVVLARAALSWGIDPVVALKLMGVIGLIGTCVAIYAITRTWFSRRIALIPCFWLLAYKGQIIWAVSGLETSVYEALVCWSVYFIFRGLGDLLAMTGQTVSQMDSSNCLSASRSIPFMVAGFILAIASMTRPEAPALMGLFTLILCFNCPRDSKFIKQQHWLNVALFCGAFLVCFVPYFIWHWFYYGRLFPNPVYCKGLTSILTYSLDKHYLKLIAPFAVFVISALFFRQSKCCRHHYFLWLPSMLYLIVLIGADPVVAFDNRLFLTAFALLLPLSTLGMYHLISKYPLQINGNLDTAMYGGAILFAIFFIPMLSLKNYRQFTENPVAGASLRQGVVAWLASHVPTSGQVVLADSGLIPYQSPHQFIDSYCLNNTEMSKLPSKFMYQRLCEDVLLKEPDAIILTSLIEKGETIYTPADACLAVKLANNPLYRKQLSLQTNNKDSYYRYEIFSKL